MRRSFGSVRGRVLAGFGVVILVTLFTAGSATVWLIQDYQRRLAVERLSDVAVAATFVNRQLEARDARPDEISAIISNQLISARVGDVRVLVVDLQGRVQAEQPSGVGPIDVSFSGRRIELPPPGSSGPPPGRQTLLRVPAMVWTEPDVRPGRPFIFITTPLPGSAERPAAPGTPGAQGAPSTTGSGQRGDRSSERGSEPSDRFAPRQTQYRIVLAVPERDLLAAWREIFPSLAMALFVAVAVSAAAAIWLSRSISLPLRQITRAAQGMARGDFRQDIPVRGRDEVAQLALAFNTMSQEVDRSHRALRDFLADASHELRTPLTSIQGFSQALVDGALTGEEGASQAGQIINDEANRMRRLVEDLLYLSRMESQDVKVARAPVDVEVLLREAGRRLALAAEQRGLTVRLNVASLPDVLGDADQLDRVFGNLIDNAGKYTPSGGTVTVSAARVGQHVRVSVHNTGGVIPAEDLPRIFERFYRVDKSRARDVEGSGLGLAIAHEVVERHGGTIDVASTAATGTTFTVTLPIAPHDQQDTRPSAPALSPASAPAA